ncbi:MAG: hypothetical protein PHE29_12415 [Tissierellia bacterium]|nr:hypothetical protein [Tissierellia bacterium]MDD4779062.1 hypothetical protein [Tissierellia bacterium]
MEKFLFECDYGIKEEVIKKLEEDVMNSLMSSIFGDINSATSTCTMANEPLTKSKLEELHRQLEPYRELREDFYKYSIPTYKIKFEDEERADNFLLSHRFLYGTPIIKPTKTITIKVQKRKHRQKRINKKWLKKYGYIEVKKEVPDYGIIANISA